MPVPIINDIPIEGKRELVFRVEDVDVEALVDQLKTYGYVVSSVSKAG